MTDPSPGPAVSPLPVLDAAYYLGLSLLGLGIAAVIHGLYDFFLGSWMDVVVGAVAILTFVAYLRSAEHITQHITGQAADSTPGQQVGA